MATTKKPAAKKVATKKPAAPVVVLKSDAEGASTYRVTGRILRNGETLRPADKDRGREADTVELTEREAYGLRGFVELIDEEAETAPE
ncbi:MAG: hypothetical protein Q8S71_11905 [Hydrogenophaga sp.]|nr:hypothetical protein [Hydrogenophaga sp.]